MSRRRDHFPRIDRWDGTHCPDRDGCERLYHRTLGGPDPGDTCECCGAELTDRYEARQTAAGRWAVFDTQTASWPGIIAGQRLNWSDEDRDKVQAVADKMNEALRG